MPCCCITYIVDLRKGEHVFWASVIEVRVVQGNSPLPILFEDNHNVGQPFGLLNFSDEPCCEESIDLLFHYFSM